MFERWRLQRCTVRGLGTVYYRKPERPVSIEKLTTKECMEYIFSMLVDMDHVLEKTIQSLGKCSAKKII